MARSIADRIATVPRVRVALLRGINVGGHRKVPMADLRAACTATGLSQLTTYIQSGNVMFEDGPADESECAELIADTIESTFGFRVPVVVRTAEQMRTSLAAHPFAPPDGDEKMLHILFCDREPAPDRVATLDPDRSPDDQWTVVGREIHVRYGKGSATSKLTVDWFEKGLDVATTGRNLLTVRAILERGG
jgi:uncharacterized protein (DUF1697 family)